MNLGDIITIKNTSVNRTEYVKIRAIEKNDIYRVSHLAEDGAWYVRRKDLSEPVDNPKHVLTRFKRNSVMAKHIAMKLQSHKESENIDEVNKQIALCKYEPNFVDCNLSEYFSLT